MDIVVYTLGCKVNQYESQGIISKLNELGHTVSTSLIDADIYILNTCAVTSEAERKSRQVISKIKSINKNAKIVICGCASENNAEKFYGENCLIIGSAGKTNIVEILQEEGILIKPLPNTFEDFFKVYPTRTRAVLKIQDGCNNFCSYCIVPYLRGRSRSREIKSILSEIDYLSSEVKEIVLTGIDLSSYGLDISSSLKDLLLNLQHLDLRIRLGSLEVGVIDEDFLYACKNLKNFCPHFHLSLQSGSDKILKLMNRHYTSKDYQDKVQLIRKLFPNAGITTDIIAGFPHETIDEFDESSEFCKKICFSDMHIFPYSIRTGTAAAKLQQVEKSEIKRRTKVLTNIKNLLKNKFLNACIGNLETVLVEEKVEEYFVGHTKNYIKVYFLGNNILTNDIIEVELKKVFKDGVFAIIK